MDYYQKKVNPSAPGLNPKEIAKVFQLAEKSIKDTAIEPANLNELKSSSDIIPSLLGKWTPLATAAFMKSDFKDFFKSAADKGLGFTVEQVGEDYCLKFCWKKTSEKSQTIPFTEIPELPLPGKTETFKSKYFDSETSAFQDQVLAYLATLWYLSQEDSSEDPLFKFGLVNEDVELLPYAQTDSSKWHKYLCCTLGIQFNLSKVDTASCNIDPHAEWTEKFGDSGFVPLTKLNDHIRPSTSTLGKRKPTFMVDDSAFSATTTSAALATTTTSSTSASASDPTPATPKRLKKNEPAPATVIARLKKENNVLQKVERNEDGFNITVLEGANKVNSYNISKAEASKNQLVKSFEDFICEKIPSLTVVEKQKGSTKKKVEKTNQPKLFDEAEVDEL